MAHMPLQLRRYFPRRLEGAEPLGVPALSSDCGPSHNPPFRKLSSRQAAAVIAASCALAGQEATRRAGLHSYPQPLMPVRSKRRF
jgi:hypothetical protein